MKREKTKKNLRTTKQSKLKVLQNRIEEIEGTDYCNISVGDAKRCFAVIKEIFELEV